jgi:hypothetical protein
MTPATGERIPQILETARALKRARRMQQQFMLMWALDRAKQSPRAHDTRDTRQARGLARAGARDDFDCNPADDLADPNNRDWKVLYRGSVLDD